MEDAPALANCFLKQEGQSLHEGSYFINTLLQLGVVRRRNDSKTVSTVFMLTR